MDKIFISYRREDSAATSGRIYDRLRDHFGKENVFIDVDSIPPGVNFERYIADILRQCGVQLAIIGPRWLDIRGKDGRRRLDDPQDPVRLEIEGALAQRIPIIPLLVEGATMPDPASLPPTLRELVKHHGMPVRYNPDFDGDMRRVIAAIEGWLTPSTSPQPPAGDLARQISAQISAAVAARDWPAVADKADLLARRAPQAMTVEVYRMQGQALLQLGEAERARVALDAALKLEPFDVPTLQMAARAYVLLKRDADAVVLLHDALALVGDRAQRLALLREYAEALMRLGQWPEALRRADEALLLSPDDPAWLETRLQALRGLQR
ncbi:MAG: TIR domain-containing protein, partial [Ktedonobacterales bacterium]|nr:TIR domain-containing protein [Ktedonobacterales bacterium]